jgi:hypothetical protein
MAGDICPACGYPTIGGGMCAARLPVVVLVEDEQIRRKESASTTAAAQAVQPQPVKGKVHRWMTLSVRSTR